MTPVWTLKKMLDWTKAYFLEKKISDTPRLDAELLLAHVLNLSRLDLYLKFDQPLSVEELATFKTLVKRRAACEPVAYILGYKDFYAHRFFVDANVLIPRPDSETLIEAVLPLIKKLNHTPLLGFEMGVGSGALSLTLLKEIKELHIKALDISPLALNVAKKNAQNLEVINRITFIEDDFLNLKNKSAIESPYSFIISNPPYISKSEILTLEKNVKDFEPITALLGGESGLDFYEPLAKFAKAHLLPEGFLAVETGETQFTAVKNIFLQNGLTQIELKQDAAGLDRVVIAKQQQ